MLLQISSTALSWGFELTFKKFCFGKIKYPKHKGNNSLCNLTTRFGS
jgi:hypothetical protein